jgi:preprotein translocase subunit Sec61beta
METQPKVVVSVALMEAALVVLAGMFLVAPAAAAEN